MVPDLIRRPRMKCHRLRELVPPGLGELAYGSDHIGVNVTHRGRRRGSSHLALEPFADDVARETEHFPYLALARSALVPARCDKKTPLSRSSCPPAEYPPVSCRDCR